MRALATLLGLVVLWVGSAAAGSDSYGDPGSESATDELRHRFDQQLVAAGKLSAEQRPTTYYITSLAQDGVRTCRSMVITAAR